MVVDHQTSGSLLFGREMAQGVLSLAAERTMRELYIHTRVSRSWSFVDWGLPVVLHVWWDNQIKPCLSSKDMFKPVNAIQTRDISMRWTTCVTNDSVG